MFRAPDRATAGYAASERVDAQRSGRSRTPLPTHPVEVWKKQISGGLEHAPVVDGEGAIVCGGLSPEIVKFAADGRELWRRTIGGAPIAASPVLSGASDVLVVTTSGQLVGLSGSGTVRFSSSLGVRGKDIDVTPVATDDGGIVVAANRELIASFADGRLRARADLPGRATGALLGTPEGIVATLESGAVVVFRPPLAPRIAGDFGGPVRRGAVVADARTLVAIVDGRRLVALDLKSSTLRTLWSTPSTTDLIDAPPTLLGDGTLLITTYGGLLLGIDRSGHEVRRSVVDRWIVGTRSDAGFVSGIDLKPSPPSVSDEGGRIVFARILGRLGVVSSEGALHVVTDRVCGSPLSVLPAGPGRFMIACRDGAIAVYGDP